MALLEQMLKKTKDKELLRTCLWGRQILKTTDAMERTDLCMRGSREHLTVKVMTWILTSFISMETIVEAYTEVREQYGFPAEEFRPHAAFLTKLLYEKVMMH